MLLIKTEKLQIKPIHCIDLNRLYQSCHRAVIVCDFSSLANVYTMISFEFE